MDVEIQINNNPSPSARFVTWAPAPCRVRVTNPAGAQGGGSPPIRISARTTQPAASYVFRRGTTGAFAATLNLNVPVNGSWVQFFAAGRFGRPSVNLNDVTIEARQGNGNKVIGSVPCTVRIRKNANTLTNGERDRFIAAFAQLNNQGLGRFQRLPRHAHKRQFTTGAWRARILALASRLPARSRARVAGNRSQRRAALLAFRSAVAKHFHARLSRRLGQHRNGGVQRDQPVTVLGY